MPISNTLASRGSHLVIYKGQCTGYNTRTLRVAETICSFKVWATIAASVVRKQVPGVRLTTLTGIIGRPKL